MTAPRRRTGRARTRSSEGSPFALVVIVTLLVGAGLGVLGYHFLRRHARIPLKSATPSPSRPAPPQAPPPRPKAPVPKGPAPGLPAATQFDFYTILPKLRHPRQGIFPHAQHLHTPGSATHPVFASGGRYTLQAASFPDEKDAQLLVARLTLRDLHAYIERARISGRGIFYRVRVGPLHRRQLAKVRTILGRMALQPIVLKETPAR
ncbi:MAG: SPOR domain-containing protein [Gammaproteobacteria bacterium]|nr:SPOR domain-containing protein [Gammaproteobacteria bacterium]